MGERNVTELNKLSINLIVILLIVTITTLIVSLLVNFRVENYNLTDPIKVAKAVMSPFNENVEDSNQQVILAITQNEEYDSLGLYKGGKTGRRPGYPLTGNQKTNETTKLERFSQNLQSFMSKRVEESGM